MMTASSSGGTVGSTFVGRVGFPLSDAFAEASGVSPPKGGLRVRQW